MVEVSLEHIRNFDIKLYQNMSNYPDEMISLLDQSIQSYFLEHYNENSFANYAQVVRELKV
jgi:DNA replicative helicase MCM subunit Mcm2 (Cdc46/Mcm family)